ncbi:MAG TPA: hypothetical protein PKE45_07050, partial [Caldilineaceae bacterium]|nr:hypothetical protein [Caldilineaceae bacterium]
SAEALTTQPTVEVKPAGAEIKSSPTASDPRNETQQLGSTGVYTDSLYHFGVGYPADFVLRNQSAEQLAAFTPEPVAVFRFMNPAIAASQLDDLEPADLEIRIYQAEAGATLESWLIANGLLPSDGSIPLQLFQTANVAGGKVCASTMIAPGCAYFVMNSGWIYQLTPATLEGETMIQTFILLP